MKKKGLAIGCAALVIAAGLAGLFLYAHRASRSPESVPEGDVLPLVFSNYDGAEVRIADLSGRAAVLISWASWCALCREELNTMAMINKEVGGAVAIIAINRAEAPETARAYSGLSGLQNKILFVLDPDDLFWHAIRGFSMPEAVFMDQEGKVRAHTRGLIPREELRRRIQDLFPAG